MVTFDRKVHTLGQTYDNPVQVVIHEAEEESESTQPGSTAQPHDYEITQPKMR